LFSLGALYFAVLWRRWKAGGRARCCTAPKGRFALRAGRSDISLKTLAAHTGGRAYDCEGPTKTFGWVCTLVWPVLIGHQARKAPISLPIGLRPPETGMMSAAGRRIFAEGFFASGPLASIRARGDCPNPSTFLAHVMELPFGWAGSQPIGREGLIDFHRSIVALGSPPEELLVMINARSRARRSAPTRLDQQGRLRWIA